MKSEPDPLVPAGLRTLRLVVGWLPIEDGQMPPPAVGDGARRPGAGHSRHHRQHRPGPARVAGHPRAAGRRRVTARIDHSTAVAPGTDTTGWHSRVPSDPYRPKHGVLVTLDLDDAPLRPPAGLGAVAVHGSNLWVADGMLPCSCVCATGGWSGTWCGQEVSLPHPCSCTRTGPGAGHRSGRGIARRRVRGPAG